MSCETFLKGNSVVRRLDPRLRIVVALLFSVLIALSSSFTVLAAGLALTVLLALAADLPAAAAWRRMLGLNTFMLVLLLVLPLSTPGEPLLQLGPLAWTDRGLRLAGAIALKANVIVLGYTVLLSTIDPVRLGHALHRLRLPDKVVHLFLFTIRYIDVIHHEYDRLICAMKVRCFRPRLNFHTFRSYGYLVGMLLVNSFDRSDRIVAAMKCRGFRGRFHVMHSLRAGGRDVVFTAISLAVLLTLGWLEWA